MIFAILLMIVTFLLVILIISLHKKIDFLGDFLMEILGGVFEDTIVIKALLLIKNQEEKEKKKKIKKVANKKRR